jgi:hypothetical protein
MKEGKVNLLVETIENESGNSLVISKSSLNAEQAVRLIQFLVGEISKVSGIEHDEVLEDLKFKNIEGED